MKGPWKVSTNIIADEKLYQVYRLIDVNQVDHSGNRVEGSGMMHDRQEAIELADLLNDIEKEGGTHDPRHQTQRD